MKKEIAELLVAHSDGCLELYEGYSGRGMYGKTTEGVSGQERDFYCSIASAFGELVDEALYSDPDSKDSQRILDLAVGLQDELSGITTDSLGMDVIFY